jgi:hypothetical protein
LVQIYGTLVAGRVWDSTATNDTVNLDQLNDTLTLQNLQPIGTPRVQSLSINGEAMLVSQVCTFFFKTLRWHTGQTERSEQIARCCPFFTFLSIYFFAFSCFVLRDT